MVPSSCLGRCSYPPNTTGGSIHAYPPTSVPLPADTNDGVGLGLFLRHPSGSYGRSHEESPPTRSSYCDQVNIEWQLRDVDEADGGCAQPLGLSRHAHYTHVGC